MYMQKTPGEMSPGVFSSESMKLNARRKPLLTAPDALEFSTKTYGVWVLTEKEKIVRFMKKVSLDFSMGSTYNSRAEWC